MLEDLLEQESQDQMLDDSFRQLQFEEEKVSSKTLSSSEMLNELFNTFGEIFSDYKKQ